MNGSKKKLSNFELAARYTGIFNSRIITVAKKLFLSEENIGVFTKKRKKSILFCIPDNSFNYFSTNTAPL